MVEIGDGVGGDQVVSVLAGGRGSGVGGRSFGGCSSGDRSSGARDLRFLRRMVGIPVRFQGRSCG